MRNWLRDTLCQNPTVWALMFFVSLQMVAVSPASWAGPEGSTNIGTMLIEGDDEARFEYWPLIFKNTQSPWWWVTREGDEIVDMGDGGDLHGWDNKIVGTMEQHSAPTRFDGPRLGFKGKIVDQTPGSERARGGNDYTFGDVPGHATWYDLLRFRMYQGEAGMEREVGFLWQENVLNLASPDLLTIGGTQDQEKNGILAENDSVPPPFFNENWPRLLRVRPNKNPGERVNGVRP